MASKIIEDLRNQVMDLKLQNKEISYSLGLQEKTNV
jgi:hypothetical protein